MDRRKCTKGKDQTIFLVLIFIQKVTLTSWWKLCGRGFRPTDWQGRLKYQKDF